MRYFFEMFRRWPPRDIPPPPLSDERGWNEDWKVGDLGRCLADNWVELKPSHPRKGQLVRVTELVEGEAKYGMKLISGLGLKGFDGYWHCAHFKKIRPEEEAADEEFTASLLSGRPAQVPT